MTGVSRNNEDIPKQLGLGQSYQNQHFGGLSFGNPSFVGKKYGGQISPGLCGHDFQQWRTPQIRTQWGTPPNAQQWGTQSNVQQWDSPPSDQQWRH
ncbi:hypothetical protein F2Q69_00013381 [Brassica cretica]|uniref:Uncharacterized protein n=1 Tax=Brassica cretica TaxID=69181 RepID=A0A8S9R6B9_BRACR|nr:hypothetical protein F2Q69_00013381 [Brassica cretica]